MIAPALRVALEMLARGNCRECNGLFRVSRSRDINGFGVLAGQERLNSLHCIDAQAFAHEAR